jgi:hypothetical protein
MIWKQVVFTALVAVGLAVGLAPSLAVGWLVHRWLRGGRVLRWIATLGVISAWVAAAVWAATLGAGILAHPPRSYPASGPDPNEVALHLTTLLIAVPLWIVLLLPSFVAWLLALVRAPASASLQAVWQSLPAGRYRYYVLVVALVAASLAAWPLLWLEGVPLLLFVLGVTAFLAGAASAATAGLARVVLRREMVIGWGAMLVVPLALLGAAIAWAIVSPAELKTACESVSARWELRGPHLAVIGRFALSVIVALSSASALLVTLARRPGGGQFRERIGCAARRIAASPHRLYWLLAVLVAAAVLVRFMIALLGWG